ncbi:hypothetical protein DFJ74DRAFT_697437 [Hyaloraphidium curvatum]|nr:hypothetical protein DFJ74DRAFT_697437 [Hyaloraphidium curvatum]
MGTNVSRLTDFTVPAAVCRWLRLVRRPKTRPISPLVRHVAGDRSCPCQECCSWAEGAAGFYSLLDVATNTVMSWVLGIFFVYTPVVTYAGALWSTWYGILLGIVWATVFPGYLLVSFVRPLVIDNLGRADLERRLLCRAVGIAMGDLLGRFRRAAAAGNPPPRPDRWSYIGLHYRFAALCSSWRRRESIWTSRIYGLVLVPVAVLFVGLCAVGTSYAQCVRTPA